MLLRPQEGCQPFPNAEEFPITSDDLCIPKPLQTVRDLQMKFLVGTGRNLVVIVPSGPPTPLTLVQNWTALADR